MAVGMGSRCVYNGGKSQANIEHLGAAFSLFTKRWHPRQEDDDMDAEGGGKVYWSSLAGFGFIHHGWRSFFAVSPSEHLGLLSSGKGRGSRAFLLCLDSHFTSPIRSNQFVSLLACLIFSGQHNTQHDRRGYRMTG